MNIREFLQSHYEISKSIDSKLEQIEELKNLARKITVGAYSESRGSGGYSDRVGRTTARIIDLENEINDEIDRLVDVKTEIMQMISLIPDSIQRTLMERHYLLHEGWECIADKIGYTPRHVCRLHNHALGFLEGIYSDRTA